MTEPQGNPRKRRAILDAASKAFLRDGFTRASVDAIAAEAGVSKQTVYNHFGDKETLFTAVTSSVQAGAAEKILALMEDGFPDPTRLKTEKELREALIRLTSGFIRAVYTSPLVDLRKLVDSEAEHHPGLRQSWYENGPRRVMPRLNRLLAGLAHAGLLDVPEEVLAEPDLLAHQLTLGTGMDVGRIEAEEDFEAEFAKRVARGVDYFLRAYAPRSLDQLPGREGAEREPGGPTGRGR